jgi:thioredoxin-dependent peroxiredoxin
VSFDDRKANSAFKDKYDFDFPLISDTDRKIALQYGAATGPKDDYARRIAYLIGPDGVIREAHGKVDAARYPAEQLQTI